MNWWKRFVLVFLAVAMGGTAASVVQAENAVTRNLILSHLVPAKIEAAECNREGPVEQFLLDTLGSVERRNNDWLRCPFMIPLRENESAQNAGSRSSWQIAMPGLLGQPLIKNNLSGGRVNGWGPAHSLSLLASTGPESQILVDTRNDLAVAGSLVGNRSRLFSGFEILVDTRRYQLELVGIKSSGTRLQLFQSRVGLGSSEYPTPRGSFYIAVIYDDKPLWIPPPSDWALGHQPSHSVYGGHMLPFYKKIPLAGSARQEEPVEELDSIAAPMKMVDGGMYRIHGTDSPWSVGSGQSHGCVRMLNKSVKGLADTLKLYVGITGRSKSANGSYVSLARPVKLILF